MQQGSRQRRAKAQRAMGFSPGKPPDTPTLNSRAQRYPYATTTTSNSSRSEEPHAPRTSDKPRVLRPGRYYSVKCHGNLMDLDGAHALVIQPLSAGRRAAGDRKSTRLNSSHVRISYAVFCLKK